MLRSSYHAWARSTSASAAGWKLTRIQPVEEPPAHVFPRDGLDLAGVDLRDAALNLGAPRGLDIWFRVRFQRFDQQPSQRRAIVLGELRRVTKQRGDVLGHASLYS